MEKKTSNTNEFQLSPKSLKALREWDEAHKEERERRKAENEREKAEKAGKKPKMAIFDEMDEFYETYGFDGCCTFGKCSKKDP